MRVGKSINRPAAFRLFTYILVITISIHNYAQVNQEFTFELKTTAANIIASRALIDLPALSGNSAAIIVATPVGNTKTLNPHPTGAWFYSGKWNFFNSDHQALIVGLTYKITYFVNPGPDQFLHLVTQQNLGYDGSYITHSKLDNNPNAQFAFFQNYRPGSVLNQFEEKVGYSYAAKKWYITNVSSSHPLFKGAVYNIVISLPTPVTPVTPVTTILLPGGVVYPDPKPGDTTSCKCPPSLPPNGIASGDLQGTYPDPMVRKILGRSLSNTAPTTGQVLKWNGTEWAPASETGGSGTTNTPAAPMQTFFKVNVSDRGLGGANLLTDANPQRIIAALSHSIDLTKNSRLVISAGASGTGPFCPVGCTDGEGSFTLRINGTDYYQAFASFKAGWNTVTGAICNYMVDLGPGTHNIEFLARHKSGKSEITILGEYSSVMVIPLQ